MDSWSVSLRELGAKGLTEIKVVDWMFVTTATVTSFDLQ